MKNGKWIVLVFVCLVGTLKGRATSDDDKQFLHQLERYFQEKKFYEEEPSSSEKLSLPHLESSLNTKSSNSHFGHDFELQLLSGRNKKKEVFQLSKVSITRFLKDDRPREEVKASSGIRFSLGGAQGYSFFAVASFFKKNLNEDIFWLIAVESTFIKVRGQKEVSLAPEGRLGLTIGRRGSLFLSVSRSIIKKAWNYNEVAQVTQSMGAGLSLMF